MLRFFKSLALPFLTLALLSGCHKADDEGDSLPPNELEPLSWMIGSWHDDEKDIEVGYSWRWALDNSFMLQDFKLQGEEDEPLWGRQILGWDPNEKKIRSWIFDSDGGFGESEWNLDGDTWYVVTSYTTGDGERGSATHTYKVVDQNTYLFSTQSSDIGGEFLPNSGPFKFVRTK